MIILDQLSNKLAAVMVEENIIKEEEAAVYAYTFDAFLEQCFYWSTLLLIGAILHQFVSSLIFLLVLFPLRSYAGGIHAPSSQLCIIFSYGIYFGVLFIAPRIPFTPSPFWWILCGMELFVVSTLAPVNTPNRHFSPSQKKTMQTKCRIICLLIYIFFSVLCYFHFKIYYSIIIVCVTIMLAGQFAGILHNRQYQREEKQT